MLLSSWCPLVILNGSRRLSLAAVCFGLLAESCAAQACQKLLWSLQDVWTFAWTLSDWDRCRFSQGWSCVRGRQPSLEMVMLWSDIRKVWRGERMCQERCCYIFFSVMLDEMNLHLEKWTWDFCEILMWLLKVSERKRRRSQGSLSSSGSQGQCAGAQTQVVIWQ